MSKDVSQIIDTGLYSQSIEGCLAARLGAHGLEPGEVNRTLARLNGALADLQRDYTENRLPLLRIAEQTEDLAAAQAALDRLCVGANTVAFFGTGGSSLGGQTLAQLAGWDIPGEAMTRSKERPRIRFFDNLDPRSLAGVLATLDLETTRFVVVSKSGNTAETLCQAIAAIDAIRGAGLAERISELFLGITEPAKAGVRNGLRDLLAAHGVAMLDHHTGIGGRFSALTNVGLLPLMVRGCDAHAVRRGASAVIAALRDATGPAAFAPAVGAAVTVALAKSRGIRTLVMMPYLDRLARFAAWHGQLWAESLGKGGEGTTPVAALGPVDQHSQLQLYMDGPREHLVSVLRLAASEPGPEIAADLAQIAGFDYMAGRTVGELVDAQARAVPDALIGAGRPVRIFELPRLDEAVMGALMMHFMLETILAGSLLGVDPFDQPAVEIGKKLAVARLNAARGS